MSDPASQFRNWLSSEVDRVLVRRLGGLTASILALQDGTLTSAAYRALNFQGAGVSVSDDPANRRVNVQIQGAPMSESSTLVVSSTAARAFTLWNGTSNNAPPSNWETNGFNDSGWSNAVVANVSGDPRWAIPGTDPIWMTFNPASNTEQGLLRQTFSLPAGVISTATLYFGADDANDGVWINGSAVTPSSAVIWTSPDPSNVLTSISRPASAPVQPADITSLLLANQTNLIAVKSRNMFAAGKLVSYKIAISAAQAIAESYVDIEDQKTSGTDGGTFTSGAWQTRTLNTVVSNTAGASLASNQITLPAGTYRCRISCPGYRVSQHQARLYSITDAATVRMGTSEFTLSQSGALVQTRSHISGRFTLTGTTVLEVQHRCNTTSPGANGFGVASGFGGEVYTAAEFWKIG